ncbi:MAG: hypothetical protein ABW169_09675 [Sphingobium sp.]
MGDFLFLDSVREYAMSNRPRLAPDMPFSQARSQSLQRYLQRRFRPASHDEQRIRRLPIDVNRHIEPISVQPSTEPPFHVARKKTARRSVDSFKSMPNLLSLRNRTENPILVPFPAAAGDNRRRTPSEGVFQALASIDNIVDLKSAPC